jgi:hypothetical protein
MQPDDLPNTAMLCRETLTSWIDHDWADVAGDLEWDCRMTLDHVINVQIFLCGNAAMRSTSRVLPARNGDPDTELLTMLDAMVTSATMLERICAGMAPDERGFHPAGQADAEGFRAQGCVEMLQHTYDIAMGFGETFAAPDDLCDRIVGRLFPWAPDAGEHADRSETLLWASGRIALPSRARLDPDWWIQAAPLAEWDGERKLRAMPPSWR